MSVSSIAESAAQGPTVAGIPVAFILFALTLLGVAIFHYHTLRVGLIGLATITAYKLIFTGFDGVPGLTGLAHHFVHEWVILANLFGLLVGFALLADHFEKSHIPGLLPALLPDDWRGPVTLLVMIFVMSTFLDNIAAAIIGGTIASSVFQKKVHLGYLAAIVAASNAGGAGSVVGDTTTTMMWIEGVSPRDVATAFLPALVALAVFSIPASLAQQKLSPIVCDPPPGLHLDWSRVAIVALILGAVIGTNVIVNTQFTELADRFPFLAAAVWVIVLVTTPWRAPDWKLVPPAALGSLFLLSLVTCASMMPVESLPAPSWQTAVGLGFVSAVFDNIPLTKLALEQGGYDWGALAFAVGFGGSMVWFGSSAGVALSTQFPQAKSVFLWLRYGWAIPLAYLAGFAVMLALIGWHPAPA
ncbi:MAG: citrate transporter [Gammaproteobacteria bacterium]|nr:citrate transporter [Gammaproteobacteria bacterium]MDH4314705.1 citrate transporter [Gammaproteobacteria bacterium]MDH5214563.1 citrate transporter [Gammaproteobacteria bacterium]MDH5500078.1 citrate transporter [Gammaproteobacteria bacterium]